MRSRSLSITLSAVYLLFTGCYQVGQIPLEEFLQDQGSGGAVFVVSDSTVYSARPNGYQVVNDSMYINGVWAGADGVVQPYKGHVPLSSISGVRQKRLDKLKTGLLVGGIVLGGLLVWIAEAMKDSFDGNRGIGKF